MNKAVRTALSEMADALGRTPIAPELVAATDKTLIDSFAVGLTGAATPELRQLVAAWPLPPGESTVWGTDHATDSATAALLNGIALCSLELDEGNKFARGHPGAHVLPAALAEAERLGSTAEELRAAFLAGYEVCARIARGFRPRPGLHPHGTWGAIGAAVAVAKLNGADAAAIAGAMDAAAGLSLAPPFSSATRGTFVRNTWVGTAGAHGITAARLAAVGLAPEHDTGMAVFDDLLGALDPDEIIADLGERWEITGGYFKRHSACNYTHPPADAALAVRAEHGFDVDDIAAIRVDTHALALPLDGAAPDSRLAAMFSIPHVVAVALVDGACTPSAFDPAVLDRPDISRLRALVTVALDDQIDTRRPAQRGARVNVTLRDGSVRVAEVPNAIGDADFHPFDRAAIEAKAADLIGLDRARAIAHLVDAFPRITDIRTATRALRGEKSRSTMKIRAITPIRVDEAEVARRQERYNRLAPAGWEIVLENLPEGAPSQLGTPEDVRASEELLLSLGRNTAPDEFDAFMPDCVLDPSVEELDADSSVAVLGLSRLGAHHLAACGHTFGVITRNTTIADEFTAMIERYGLAGSYRGSFVLDLGVEAVSDHDAWNAAVRTQVERAEAAGVTTLINGCSAVDIDTEGTGVRIVDPIELAFEVAAAGENAGLLP